MLKAFFEGLDELGSLRVKVGIQGNEAQQIRSGGLSMVDLGTIHEFGAPRANVPQRSFLRSTADANRSKYERSMAKSVRKLANNPRSFNARGELFLLGERVRGDVIKRIRAHIPPPLAAATIARKGEDVPLIDTGQLINSIRSVVA